MDTVEAFDVMISYRVPETGQQGPGRPNADGTASKLTQLLEAAGYCVFLDVHNLQGGSNWLRVITRAVRSCTAFVPVISTTYGDEKESPFTYQEYIMAREEKKIIVPVYHSGRFPPSDLRLVMGTLNYVPQAGAMTGPVKTTVDEVAKEVIVALKCAGVPMSGASQLLGHSGPMPGTAAAVGPSAGSGRIAWDDLCDITAAGKAELAAAGLTPATGQALISLGYTEPGDLQLIRDQLQSLCHYLPPIQMAKLEKLACVQNKQEVEQPRDDRGEDIRESTFLGMRVLQVDYKPLNIAWQ